MLRLNQKQKLLINSELNVLQDTLNVLIRN